MNLENQKYRNLLRLAPMRNTENIPSEVNVIRSAYSINPKTPESDTPLQDNQKSKNSEKPLIKAPPPDPTAKPKKNPLDILRQINEDREKRGLIDPQTQGGPKRGTGYP